MPLTTARDPRRTLTAVLSALVLALAMLAFAAPAAHAAGGTVTGVVTNSVGTPIDGADVHLFDPEDEDGYYEYDSTDGTGHFTFTGVPAGTFKLFVDEVGSSVGTYFPSAATSAEAGTITVTANATSTANVQMIKAASIAGTVTKPGGAAAVDAEVIAYRSFGGRWDSVSEEEIYTNASGSYVVKGLAAGTYVIGARLDGYQPAYSGNAHTVTTATPIVVANGATVTGADLGLELGGAVSGTVKDRNGTPVRGAELRVSSASGTVEYGTTNSAGGYTVSGLPSGTYTVASIDTRRYTRASTTASVTVPSTTSNVNLVVTQLTVVTGTVRDHTGAPVSEGDMTVFQKVGSKFVYTESYAYIDGGVYSVALAPGTYRIQAQGYYYDEEEDEGGYLDTPTFFGNVTTLGAATDIKVNSYEDTIGGRNIQLVQGATLTGTVDVPAGVDLEDEGVPVEVIDPATGEIVAGTYSDGGSYEIGGIPAGSYKVQFARGGSITPLAGQYYNGISESAGRAAATTVTLAKGQTKTNVNATLTNGSHLTGTVKQVDGDPAPGCLVQAFTTDDHLSARYAFTEADGTFTIDGLAVGDVDLAVHPAPNGNTEEEAYDNAWACVGLPNPDDNTLPGSGYYSAVNGILSTTQKSLRTVAVGGAPSTAMPVALQFDNPAQTVQNLTVPVITGSPIVGNELTAGTGTWDPADVDLSYQWWIGEYIVGDGPTFTPTPNMVDEKITLTVTANADGYAGKTVTSAATEPVAAEAFVELENATVPKITGTAKVGQTLTASNGTWTPSGPDQTFSYQWLRNGSPIAGATKVKYTAGAADLGVQLRVKVTAAKPGALNRSSTTAATASIKAGTLVTKGGSVSGKAKVGKKLKATPPRCTPGATVRYRWLRNGTPISGATKSTYKAKSGDKGKKLSVKITLTRAGYTTVVKTIKAGKVS